MDIEDPGKRTANHQTVCSAPFEPSPNRLLLNAWVLFCVLLPITASLAAENANLVSNGLFATNAAGVPGHWRTAGGAEVAQRISIEPFSAGTNVLRLDCTGFEHKTGASHAMVCQTGIVALRKDRWYRTTFWAKAANLTSFPEFAVAETKKHVRTGIGEAFNPGKDWQLFEFTQKAETDVPADESRLQFWFTSTGTLWLRDVQLVVSEEGQQWYPQISTDGVKNFVPNSSFECGAANWGSVSLARYGWGEGLFRLEGLVDAAPTAPHGGNVFKITLDRAHLPIMWFDYRDQERRPVSSVLVANHGWFNVKPGEPLTLSAWLRADREQTPAELLVVGAPKGHYHKTVTAGLTWKRQEFSFVPTNAFVFIGVGLDLNAAGRDRATLRADGIQLERGANATPYEPRHSLESFIETALPGNTFTNPAKGMSFTLRAFNNDSTKRTLSGKFAANDFFDQSAWNKQIRVGVPAHSGSMLKLNKVLPSRTGFYRVSWQTADQSQSLRCASIVPLAADAADAPFGFNHAYPRDFLVRQARLGGILWWRNWSAQWQVVEPQKGHFDFAAADEQIDRVRNQNCAVDVLLPFPSTDWSTSATAESMKRQTNTAGYGKHEVRQSFAPTNWNEFGVYAGKVAEHYGAASTPALRPVRAFQILNEPINTYYSLAAEAGYTIEDYIRFLQISHDAIKQSVPNALIIGGISDRPDAKRLLEFVRKDGARHLDVLDMHMYEAYPAESYEKPYQELQDLLQQHGGPKTWWITEWGCYADDDPPVRPLAFHEWSMDHARWPSERAATEHIVKFAAVSFAHGVRKIFFHAGNAGTLNGPDASGVLFEYGGTPRKMYSGISAFTQIIGVPESFVKKLPLKRSEVFLFQTQGHLAAVAWATTDNPKTTVHLSRRVRAWDIMGNELHERTVPLSQTPIYLTSSADVDEITRAITE